jgi:predicted nucleotide-binding protein (sugar kinase/HSP70/actin superfamily)
MRAGWSALDRFLAELRAAGDRVLSRVEREGGLAVVVLGRPYHGDPGVNHGIPEAIQRLGYPVLPIEALPVDEARIARLFGEGGPPVGVHFPEDAARTTYSENSTRKLWAARYVARHPNLAAVDLSSFRCGHDAPIYDVVQRALDESGTPCLAFHDLDENRPAASLEIRLETLAFFLDRHAENLPRPAPGAGALAARG